MPDYLDDQWSTTDYPILREIVRRLMDPTDIRPVLHTHIEESFGDTHTPAEVTLALNRLASYGYINGIEGGPQLILRVTGVTERAIRATGVWPSSDRAATQDLIRFV